LSAPPETPDLAELVGSTFDTKPFSITASEVADFKRATHLTRVYGENAGTLPGYPPKLVEGFQVLSLLDPHTHEVLNLGPSLNGWNYGLDRVRFIEPVEQDRDYYLKIAVTGLRQRPTGHVLTLDCEVRAVGAQKPSVAARWLVILRPSEGAEQQS
jgi:acyl dehydratase